MDKVKQKRARNAAKTAEREFAKRFEAKLGRAKSLDPILTSTGRAGQLTYLQFDFAAGEGENKVIGEAKNWRVPVWLKDALVKIYGKGIEFGRTPVLGLKVKDDVDPFVEVNGKKYRVPRHWIIVPLEDYLKLLKED